MPRIEYSFTRHNCDPVAKSYVVGNGVRLSKAILGFAGLSVDDEVEILAEKGKIIILPVRKHRTLEDRVAEYAESHAVEHIDWGPDVGKEEW